MALALTSEILACAYDYLLATQPFCEWSLPDGEDVVFRVVKTRERQGRHYFENNKHVIDVSSAMIGRTQSLIELMAHEMVHVHLKETNMCKARKGHGAVFKKCAEQVCAVHGFDPQLF